MSSFVAYPPSPDDPTMVAVLRNRTAIANLYAMS